MKLKSVEILALAPVALFFGTSILVAAGHAEAKSPSVAAQTAIQNIASEHSVPSAVVVFVDNGAISETVLVGFHNGPGTPTVSDRSVFQIASVSKVFTGIIANALVREGKLEYADPVTEYLPDDLSDEARQNLAGVTVGHVIHHRSGLPRDTAVNPRIGNEPMREPLTEADLLEDLAIADMVGDPGERYEYSNLGYGLLGYVLERASGESYAELVDRIVTGPLAMEDTSPTLADSARERLVTPYRKEDPIAPTEPWQTGKLVAASGLYSSARDLARLMVAQLEAYADCENSSRDLVTTTISEPTGDGRQYGFGMNVQPVDAGDETVKLHFHSGDMDGFAAFYGFIPSRQ